MGKWIGAEVDTCFFLSSFLDMDDSDIVENKLLYLDGEENRKE